MIDVKSATKAELLEEYEKCIDDWSKFSSDCFGFYITALHRRIVDLGGWPPR